MVPLKAATLVVARPSTEVTPFGSVTVTEPASPTPAASVNATQLGAPVALSTKPLPTRSTEFASLAKKVAPVVGVAEV